MRLLICVVLSVLLIGLLGCEDAGIGVRYFTEPIKEDHGNITDPRARWQAYNLTSYVIDQQSSCFCPYGGDVCKVYVQDNKVIDVITLSDGQSIFAQAPRRYKTVDELFALVSSINPDSVASLIVQYDTRFGFPAFISVDYSTQIADEEFSYHSQNIQRLLK